jgi:hypothetical protein
MLAAGEHSKEGHVTKVTKAKLFMADDLTPAATPTGTSLEEQLNAFLAPLGSTDLLDVTINTSKGGKFGCNPVFTASVLYKG